MTVDLTGIATTVIAGIFTVLGIVIPMLLDKRMKDKQAAATLGAAIKNSLGALQQEAIATARGLKPAVIVPAGVPPELAVCVQYVLDHAGDEADRFGITPAAIANKVSAQIGLAVIAQKVAAATGAPIPGIGALVSANLEEAAS